MIRPAIDATIASLCRALQSARIDLPQLHTVLLVGGSSRIPMVAHLVSAELGRPTSVDAHPKHAVALGAAAVGADTARAATAAAPVRLTPPPGDKARAAEASAPMPRNAGAFTLRPPRARAARRLPPRHHPARPRPRHPRRARLRPRARRRPPPRNRPDHAAHYCCEGQKESGHTAQPRLHFAGSIDGGSGKEGGTSPPLKCVAEIIRDAGDADGAETLQEFGLDIDGTFRVTGPPGGPTHVEAVIACAR